jgi:hypothetical protein
MFQNKENTILVMPKGSCVGLKSLNKRVIALTKEIKLLK